VLPLIRGTLNNIEAVGVPGALTGPIMRGDVQTIHEHLAAMARRTPELIDMYKTLARHTVSVAEAKGTISGTDVAELLKEIDSAEGPERP
jgi:predicted short-subunit dehydrogenase-like oxidoreductase (DUF2520 family)